MRLTLLLSSSLVAHLGHLVVVHLHDNGVPRVVVVVVVGTVAEMERLISERVCSCLLSVPLELQSSKDVQGGDGAYFKTKEIAIRLAISRGCRKSFIITVHD